MTTSTPNDENIFRFRFTLFVVDAKIEDDRLEAKTGIKTISVPLSRLQHLYVHTPRDAQVSELLLSYLHKGRLKRVRLYSDPGEPNFERLVKALLARRPDIDIGHLEVHEAYVRLGSRELEWLVIPAVMGLGVLIVTLLFAPMLIHGFDGGHTEVTVAQLAEGESLDTHHLTVVGRADVKRMVRIDPRPGVEQRRVGVWMPLVAEGAPPEAPVDVILETRIDPDTLDEFAAAEKHQGILRNIWWEGLDGAQKKTLIASGIQLSSDVKLFHEGVRPRDELTLSLSIVGFMFFILVTVTVVLRKRSKGPVPRRPVRRPPIG